MTKSIEEQAEEYAQSNFRRDDDDKVILTAKELRSFICMAYKVGAKALDSEITALKAENAELTQSELECRQLYNEFVGDLNTARIKNTELESEVATLKTELEELQKTYTLESGGPY